MKGSQTRFSGNTSQEKRKAQFRKWKTAFYDQLNDVREKNEERVKKIVVEHLGVEDAKIQSDSKFIDDLGADSLDTVELVMAFEEEFGCEIPDDAAEKIVTLKDAVTYLTANSN